MNRSSIFSAEELGGWVQAVYHCWELFFLVGGGRWLPCSQLSSHIPLRMVVSVSPESHLLATAMVWVRHLPNLVNHTSHPLATLIDSSWDQDSNLSKNIPFLLSCSKTVFKQFSLSFLVISLYFPLSAGSFNRKANIYHLKKSGLLIWVSSPNMSPFSSSLYRKTAWKHLFIFIILNSCVSTSFWTHLDHWVLPSVLPL